MESLIQSVENPPEDADREYWANIVLDLIEILTEKGC